MSACGHITHQECMHQRMKEGVDFCERCVRKYLPMNVQPSKDTSKAQDLANTSPSVNLNPTPLATSIFSFYRSHEINPLFSFFFHFYQTERIFFIFKILGMLAFGNQYHVLHNDGWAVGFYACLSLFLFNDFYQLMEFFRPRQIHDLRRAEWFFLKDIFYYNFLEKIKQWKSCWIYHIPGKISHGIGITLFQYSLIFYCFPGSESVVVLVLIWNTAFSQTYADKYNTTLRIDL